MGRLSRPLAPPFAAYGARLSRRREPARRASRARRTGATSPTSMPSPCATSSPRGGPKGSATSPPRASYRRSRASSPSPASRPGMATPPRPACADRGSRRACRARSLLMMPANLADGVASLASDHWIGARDRAVLLLMYGAGLRIAEALSLTAADLPLGETLRVTGKGGKQRVVPLLPVVREAVADYAERCPWPLAGKELLFKGAKGGPLGQGMVQKAMAQSTHCARAAADRDSARVATQLCDPLAWRRGRPEKPPGTARPRQPRLDADLYQSRCGYVARYLSKSASAGARLDNGRTSWLWGRLVNCLIVRPRKRSLRSSTISGMRNASMIHQANPISTK